MVANALLLTIVLLLAYAFWLLDQLKFIAPYKTLLFHAYGHEILFFASILFLNVFGAALAVNRRFLLKDTGRKLSHLDRQFRVDPNSLPSAMAEEELN